MGHTYTSFLNPNDYFDAQVIRANNLVREWMRDPENIEFLNQLKAEAIHTKGNSTSGNIKHKHIIPQEAFLVLPDEIRKDKKMLDKWVAKYHPYLLITK